MKVVHIITGLGRGGAESALYRLLSAQEAPARFTVVSLTDEGVFAAPLRALGVTVISLGCRSALGSALAIRRIVRLLKVTRPDLVQTWMYHSDLIGGIAAKIAGVPVCWGIRNSVVSAKHIGVSTRVVAHVCSLLSPTIPATIVSCSRRAVVCHRKAGYSGNFVLIQNGIDVRDTAPPASDRAEIRRSLGIETNTLVIGHVSRAHPMKDHPTLFAAFGIIAHSLPHARLLVVGEGLKRGHPYFDAHVEQLGGLDRVHALGAREDVMRLMGAMDVFVLTSASEAFPNVVVEAMACGVPCIVTDVGDSAEIVGDTGWICRPGAPAEIADAIVQALTEAPEERTARSAAARRRVEDRFSLAAMVAGYNSVWNAATNDGTASCAV